MTADSLNDRIEAGEIVGSRAALDRVRRTCQCAPLGINGYGDWVYDLGRLPGERATKHLYLHPFRRPNATGGRFRAYVQAAP